MEEGCHRDVYCAPLIGRDINGLQQGPAHALALVGRRHEHLGHADARLVREAPEVEDRRIAGLRAPLTSATPRHT